VSAVSGSESGFIEVDGLRLRYQVRGSGPPLLLIMGLGGHLDLWRPLQETLPDFETIAFDAPGSGESSVPAIPMAMSRLARVTGGMLDALGYRRVDVLGVSIGGALAQELARQASYRVRRLVLLSTACGIGAVPGDPVALLTLANPYCLRFPGWFTSLAPAVFGGRLRTEPDLVCQVAGRWLAHSPSLWGYYSQAASLWGWSSLPWLHLLPQPTLVLTGDDDPIVPAINARLLARRIPRARLEILPGGHLLLLEQTDSIARLVREFLRENLIDRPLPTSIQGTKVG
jgi:poly(3-hydroxyalkanoate) depolymerase